MRYYLKNGDYNSLINTCKRLGKMQPSLWLQALTGLRDNKNAPSNLLSQILQVISNYFLKIYFKFKHFVRIILFLAQDKLQSPLQVLMCLSVENGPNLSAVRDYFLQVFQRDNELARNVSSYFKKISF